MCSYRLYTPDDMWQGKDPSLIERTSLSVDICDLLSLCLDATCLMFKGNVYQQTCETAIGSLVSVVVASLVMEDIDRCPCPPCIHPLYWKRYVDDTCTALPPDFVDFFQQHLNSIDPNIQLYCREEGWSTPLPGPPAQLGLWWLHWHFSLPKAMDTD